MSDRRRSGGGNSRHLAQENDRSLVRHEEEARVDKRWEGVGYAGARRDVESGIARAEYPLQRDELGQERVPVGKNDSGKIETLPDGSISVRLFEEELVVKKLTVPRERVIIRKETVTDFETVEGRAPARAHQRRHERRAGREFQGRPGVNDTHRRRMEQDEMQI